DRTHHQIEYNQLWIKLRNSGDGLLSIRSAAHLKTRVFKIDAQHMLNISIILYHQNACGLRASTGYSRLRAIRLIHHITTSTKTPKKRSKGPGPETKMDSAPEENGPQHRYAAAFLRCGAD